MYEGITDDEIWEFCATRKLDPRNGVKEIDDAFADGFAAIEFHFVACQEHSTDERHGFEGYPERGTVGAPLVESSLERQISKIKIIRNVNSTRMYPVAVFKCVECGKPVVMCGNSRPATWLYGRAWV